MDTTPLPPPLPQPGSTLAPPPLDYASQPAGPYALYSPQAVGLATFLGAPLGGTAIMAMNYRRLGRPSSAFKAIMLGILATAALVGLGFALPSSTPGFLIAIVPLVIMIQLAKLLQGNVFDRHKLAGGRVASLWKAAGVGLLSMIILLAIIVVIVIAQMPSKGTRVAFGSSEIFYSGSATQADAQALGKALTDDGYFAAGRAFTVLLVKDSSGTTIKFVVNEDAGQKDSTLDNFTAVVEQIAPSVGGKPITLKLLNPELKELKSKKVE